VASPIITTASFGVGMIEYRDIPGVAGYIAGSDGSIISQISGKALMPSPHGRRGYLRVTPVVNGRKMNCFVHRLVALAFIENPRKLPQVLHSDDDPRNNAVGNLRWGTQSGNESDKAVNGNAAVGGKNGSAKFTDDQIAQIRLCVASDVSSVRKRLGMSESYAYAIRAKAWRA